MSTTLCSHAPRPISIDLAGDEDRTEIYRLRHEIYACELGQHLANVQGVLTDALDASNLYITARVEGELAGFVSLTPPHAGTYSVEKYLSRSELPFACDEGLFEVRILTVAPEHRGTPVALLLMYAALRWIESHHGTRIVGIGRREVLNLYARVGFQTLGRRIQSGQISFELMTATPTEIRRCVQACPAAFERMISRTEWRLEVPLKPNEPCFHGGAFWQGIGDDLRTLERRHSIVNADVLDAWFPPSPRVVDAVQRDLAWLLQTSPPTGCEGMLRVIARIRGVKEASLLPGDGSSRLIFHALRSWLTPTSKVLLLDPTYGEYRHALERVIGCEVERLELRREDGYVLDPARVAAATGSGAFDLVILVNPNSPTGRHVPKRDLVNALREVPSKTRVWIDETYVDYAGSDESLEAVAAASENLVVCKSLSKVLALSGARAAYLCGPESVIASLRRTTPPWAVGLPAQLAVVNALSDPAYYLEQYARTHSLRRKLAQTLAEGLGFEVVPSVINAVLCHLPEGAPTAMEICERCRLEDVYLRDAASFGANLGDSALRIAVKDEAANERILAAVWRALTSSSLRQWQGAI